VWKIVFHVNHSVIITHTVPIARLALLVTGSISINFIAMCCKSTNYLSACAKATAKMAENTAQDQDHVRFSNCQSHNPEYSRIKRKWRSFSILVYSLFLAGSASTHRKSCVLGLKLKQN
jgi:hypothetical protein